VIRWEIRVTFWLGMGYECAVTPFECELVLRENGGEARQPHTFIGEVRPGTFVYMNDRDWIVIEIQEGETPSVICRPVAESEPRAV
jgi:hypothetical protein